METSVFKPTDPISVLSFLKYYNTACDSTSSHERAAIWLSSHFNLEPVKADLSHWVRADEKNRQQEGQLTIYFQAVNYSLQTNATDDDTAEAEAKIPSFKDSAGMTTVRYPEALLQKALRCVMIYNEPMLEWISIEAYGFIFAIQCVPTGKHTKKLHYIAWLNTRQTS